MGSSPKAGGERGTCKAQLQRLSVGRVGLGCQDGERGDYGTGSARTRSMGVAHFTELRCWQQSAELKGRLYAICARSPACQDRDYCSQVKRAAASAPRNIAEGFARFNHREFQQFLRIARGSLGELQDALIDARDRGYVKEPEFTEVWHLSESAIGSTTGLMKYLNESKDRRFWGNERRN